MNVDFRLPGTTAGSARCLWNWPGLKIPWALVLSVSESSGRHAPMSRFRFRAEELPPPAIATAGSQVQARPRDCPWQQSKAMSPSLDRPHPMTGPCRGIKGQSPRPIWTPLKGHFHPQLTTARAGASVKTALEPSFSLRFAAPYHSPQRCWS